MSMKEHAEDLVRRRARASRMGGDDAVARQHAAGKLTVCERETRPTLIRALEMARTKRVDRPWRRHGVTPV